ncbi:MFS transporter [Nocardia panacis]|uniref:MFS transporter n=1 Tax=Nocardia panacis TaxID=2340916 RepID=A0A3A4KIQ7_9NOCA|nr:MDR family MFS transporter [Nocardia panacis]RJO73573.1 MFS transporter [Nocardia panacis]
MATGTEEVSVGLRSARGKVLASLMLASGLVALDSTIIATAVLGITNNLGGFAQFPWLFSIYLLAQAVSTPIYGKIADTIGRKPVILIGIGTFALGSLLCGMATSMVALIIFRAVQGLGAGAIGPMSMTIAGDVYTLTERAKVQGYLASVWALSSVLGPLLGGIFTDYLSWRWIFFVNLPLAAVAAWMLVRHFNENTPRQRHRADYLGAGLLTLGAGALILGLLEGGQAWAWNSPTSIVIFAGGAAVLALFAFVQTRAANPVLPLWIFTRRVVIASSTASMLIGAIMVGLTSYVPTFAQGVLGSSALLGGLTVGALTLGWPLSASQAGKVYLRIGFRATAAIGSGLAALGGASTLLINQQSSLLQIAASCFVIGSGLGLVATPTLIAAQMSAEWTERGVVTSANLFARSLGSAVGIAIFGAIVNAAVHHADHPAAEQLSPAVHKVFLAVAGMAIVMLCASAMMPRRDATTA